MLWQLVYFAICIFLKLHSSFGNFFDNHQKFTLAVEASSINELNDLNVKLVLVILTHISYILANESFHNFN